MCPLCGLPTDISKRCQELTSLIDALQERTNASVDVTEADYARVNRLIEELDYLAGPKQLINFEFRLGELQASKASDT